MSMVKEVTKRRRLEWSRDIDIFIGRFSSQWYHQKSDEPF